MKITKLMYFKMHFKNQAEVFEKSSQKLLRENFKDYFSLVFKVDQKSYNSCIRIGTQYLKTSFNEQAAENDEIYLTTDKFKLSKEFCYLEYLTKDDLMMVFKPKTILEL